MKNLFRKYTATYTWFDLRNFTEFVEKSSPDQIVALLNQHYSLIEKTGQKFKGQIIDYLGDGVGVLFKGESQTRRALDTALICLKTKLVNKIRVGVGMEKGEIIQGKSKNIKITPVFYTGPAIIKTFRLGVLASQLKKPIIISHRFYAGLGEKEKKNFKFLKSVQLKGFKQKDKLYCFAF